MSKFRGKYTYSPESPSGLVWTYDRFWGANHDKLHIKAGERAGYLNNEGYWMVYDLDSKRSLGCHRVVYELVSGNKIPNGMQVDHVDGNRGNNRFENLRVVDHITNRRNCKLSRKSGTKVQGVYWQENNADNLFAVASWNTLCGKRRRKYFSVLKLGMMEAFKQAVICRQGAIESLNFQGAGYSDRHGT